MKRPITISALAFLSLFCLSVADISAEERQASDILAIARKVNNYFMAKYADPTAPTNVKKIRPSNLWTRGVYYEGLMALYSIDPDKRYADYTDRWATFHKWSPRNGLHTTDADDQCCGQAYTDRYRQTGSVNSYMVEPIIKNLDYQIATGRVDYWTWIDAIQMAMPLYAYVYKITGERKYIDYAMKSYRWSRDEGGCKAPEDSEKEYTGGLFNRKTGFWWRDKDYVPPYKESDGSYCYWSRGDGWVYAALLRVMQTIGKKDPYYKELKKDFLLMTKAIVSCQRDDGLWNVSLVCPADYGGKELTGSALFLYGLSWGINNHILKAKRYKPICDRIYNALADDCVHNDGFLGYVQGTGKDPSAGQPVTYNSVPDFEDYGTGCFLLAMTEYYKLLSGK